MDKNRRKPGVPNVVAAKKRNAKVGTPAQTPQKSAYQAVRGSRTGEVISPPNNKPADTPAAETPAITSPAADEFGSFTDSATTSRETTPRQPQSSSGADHSAHFTTVANEGEPSSKTVQAEPLSSTLNAAEFTNTAVEEEQHVAEAENAPSQDEPEEWEPSHDLVRPENDILQRFQEEMQSHAEKETQLMAKLARLIMMQQAWAISGSAQEVERSSKRLRTRVAYVQHRESELVTLHERYQHARANMEKAVQGFD